MALRQSGSSTATPVISQPAAMQQGSLALPLIAQGQRIASEKPAAMPQQNRSANIWLCLQLPLLGLECLSDYHAAEPSALLDGQRIVLSNPEAEEHGIQPGLPLATAEMLYPNLRLFPEQKLQAQRCLDALAEEAYGFSAHIHRDGNSLCLEIASALRLFKGIKSLVQTLASKIQAQGLSYRIALGHTPKAAALALHIDQPWQQLLSSPYQLDSAALNALLGEVNISALACSNKVLRQLHNSGIQQFRQLRNLPIAALRKRFGKDFAHYIAEVQGLRQDPKPQHKPAAHFEQSLFYTEPMHSQQTLEPVMHLLIEELCHYLGQRQLQCQELHWQLQEHQGKSWGFSISSASPNSSNASFKELSAIKLEQLQADLSVNTVTLRVEQFSPIEDSVSNLFQDLESTLRDINKLQDRLKARLGEERIYQVRSLNQQLPEDAWESGNFSEAGEHTRKAETKTKTERNFRFTLLDSSAKKNSHKASNKTRPLWLLRSPAPLKEKDGELYWHSKLERLGRPEKISGCWWRRSVSRDYFIARSDEGKRYWVYQHKGNKRWYLQGLFA